MLTRDKLEKTLHHIGAIAFAWMYSSTHNDNLLEFTLWDLLIDELIRYNLVEVLRVYSSGHGQ